MALSACESCWPTPTAKGGRGVGAEALAAGACSSGGGGGWGLRGSCRRARRRARRRHRGLRPGGPVQVVQPTHPMALFWSLATVIQVMAKVSYIIGCMNYTVHLFCSHVVTLLLVLVRKNRAASIQKTETMLQFQNSKHK